MERALCYLFYYIIYAFSMVVESYTNFISAYFKSPRYKIINMCKYFSWISLYEQFIFTWTFQDLIINIIMQ